jgi:N-acetylmuramoyl-L-alanine amidase
MSVELRRHMALRTTIRNCWWGGGCAAVLCCAIVLSCAVEELAAKAVTHRKVELTPWEQAERGLETLDTIPVEARTRADYTRAMDGFRAVYHEAPGNVHAPESVNAVAVVLGEPGRALQDANSLQAAVGEYGFLRTPYPASSLRVAALLAQAQIYQNDLHDAAAAKEKYSLLVKQYPRSAQAEEARAGIASLSAGSREEGVGSRGREASAGAAGLMSASGSSSTGSGSTGFGSAAATSAASALPGPAGAGEKSVGVGSGASSFAPMPTTGEARGVKSVPVDSTGDAGNAERRGTLATAGAELADGTAGGHDAWVQAAAALHVAKTSGKRHGQMAQVTGIRHWSTPDYTRVAIDLGDDVTYEAARVPNPDRIYFDLHGTRLAQELVGKSFAVTDDGFLKKIRAAQFSNDMTRVVLDVNDVTGYSAFLLPNPYRLIIDIHGGSKAEPVPPVAGVPMQRAAAATPTVPNTTAVKAGNSFDVAALSAQPGRVEATTQPTSQPISAVVPRAGSREEGVGSSKLAASDIAAAPASSSTSSSSTRKGRKGKVAVDADAVPARAAVPTADGGSWLVRARGVKIVGVVRGGG